MINLIIEGISRHSFYGREDGGKGLHHRAPESVFQGHDGVGGVTPIFSKTIPPFP